MLNRLNLPGMLSAAALLTSFSRADAMVLGAFENNFSCAPFCYAETMPYQQIYGSGNFSAPITISSITFYTSFPNILTNKNPFALSLSTTLAAVDGLGSTPSSNLGSDNLLVYSGALPALSGNTMTFILSSAFTYNPALGNLLLTITSSGPDYVFGAVAFNATSSSTDQMSRLYAGATTDTEALVTGFNEPAAPAPVPLPAALPLFASGAALVGVMVRRRQQARRSD